MLSTCAGAPPLPSFLLFKAHYRLWSDLTSFAPEMEDCAERNDISIQGGFSKRAPVHSSFTFPKAFTEILNSVTSVLLDSRRVLKKRYNGCWLMEMLSERC